VFVAQRRAKHEVTMREIKDDGGFTFVESIPEVFVAQSTR